MTGIDTGEGRMIKAVLDMQDTEVGVGVWECFCVLLRKMGIGVLRNRIRG